MRVQKKALKILDNDCAKANLPKMVKECQHLSTDEKRSLLKLFQQCEDLFEGKVGTWNQAPVSLESKEGAKPWCGRAHTPPVAHAKQTRKECNRLVECGMLQKINDSKWGHPTFVTPKKDGKIRFITNLWELNKRIKRNPFPLPNVHDLLLQLEGFDYASATDLNVGYCRILLDEEASKMCTIVMPWAKHKHLRLPQGQASAPDIFQDEMNNVFHELEFV